MQMISRPVHGVIDYVYGALFAASPWLFGFSQQHFAPEFALIVGLGTILYSLLTNYEWGLVRLFPFTVHLFLDLCVGFVVATNWLHFAFKGRAAVVFTIMGVMALLVTALTKRPVNRSTTIT